MVKQVAYQVGAWVFFSIMELNGVKWNGNGKDTMIFFLRIPSKQYLFYKARLELAISLYYSIITPHDTAMV